MSNETNDRATKGPWHTALTAHGHAVLANTDHGTANMVAIVLSGTTDGQPEHNARLIAAAPEMAALLERNQNVIMDALTSGHGITPAIADDMRAVLAEARALLAKIKKGA